MLELILAAAAALTPAAQPAQPATPPPAQPQATSAAPGAAKPAGPPPEIEFTGKTDANGPLIWDAMQEVIRFSGHHLKCGQITKVDASILPPDWQPGDPNFRIGPPTTRYERWEVTMCGKTDKFLLGFWNDAKAGVQFSVGHPFPKEEVPGEKG